ncbi:MAG: SHOCT-like domain-containing protein [Planctomycetota bacterium]|jgi:hypothetical protein
MTDKRKKILEMLAQDKISIDEASKLLELTSQSDEESVEEVPGYGKKKPKYLRVVIKPTENANGGEFERVNIRVPMSLIRAGVKFSSLIPDNAANQVDSALKEKGINFNLRNIKDEDIERLLESLSDLEVDIEGGQGKVNVFTE